MIVYKIMYPNGKIYVGSDKTDSISYFGSPNDDLIAADFTDEQRRDFTVRRQILWCGNDAKEMRRKEVEYIIALRANDPVIGYNRSPKCPLKSSINKSSLSSQTRSAKAGERS